MLVVFFRINFFLFLFLFFGDCIIISSLSKGGMIGTDLELVGLKKFLLL